MNRQEFEDTARRYREELFRMYANQNPAQPRPPQGNRPPMPPPPPQGNRPPMPPPPPQGNRPPILPPPLPKVLPVLAQADALPDSDEPPENAQMQPEDFAPSGIPDTQPEEERSEYAKRPYTGIIRVNVMTAQGARPVIGASVMITHMVHGEPELVSLQRTDENGTITPVTVPAPPPSADQRNPAYYAYNLSVQAAGYYREHSEDVPVFPNVTSVQTFDMIPLPAGTDEPLPGGDLTYYNQMQQY